MLRWILLVTGSLLLVLLATPAILSALQISLSLDPFRAQIESATASALGREVRIEGPIALVPGLRPTVSVEDMRVAGTLAREASNFAHLSKGRIRLDVPALLRGQLHLEEIDAEGVELFLESSSSAAEEDQETEAFETTDKKRPIEFTGLDTLALRRVTVYYRETDPERVFEFRVNELNGSGTGNEPMQLDLEGTLQELPYSLTLTGGPYKDLLNADQPWPFELLAGGAGAKLSLEGVAAASGDASGSQLTLKLEGERIGDLAPWLDMLSSSAALPYALAGDIRLTTNDLSIDDLTASLGRTAVSGKLGWTDLETSPILYTTLSFDGLDPAELETVLAVEEPENEKKSAEQETESEGFHLDLPLLASNLTFDDADIELSANRIYLKPTDITDVDLTARLREGRLESAPFQAGFGETRLAGDLALDLSGETPQTNLRLTAGPADIGELLGKFGIAENTKATVDRLEIDVAAWGVTPREFLTQSELLATIEGGRWIVDDPQLSGETTIDIGKGTLHASAGKPLTLHLEGKTDKVPVKLKLESDNLATLLTQPEKVKFALDAEAAATRLTLKGAVALPVEQSKLTLAFSLRGQRLDNLEKFIATELPPLGPYEMQGNFNMVKDGYYLSGLDVRIGRTDLIGDAALQITDGRPFIGLKLRAGRLQLNDFYQGSLIFEPADNKGRGESTQSANIEKAWKQVLSPESLRDIDISASLQVKQTLSGKDVLGGGKMELTVQDGRLTISPVAINLPGGALNLRFVFEPMGPQGVKTELAVEAERFHYGILARRNNPESDMDGHLTINTHLTSLDPDLENLLANASGHLHFVLWPGNLEAGDMDLWALSLFSALGPELDSEPASRVNCVVGRLLGPRRRARSGASVDRYDSGAGCRRGHHRPQVRADRSTTCTSPQGF